jgi:hypothetical protein
MILNQIQPCKVNLTHTLGIPTGRSKATVSLIFRVMDQGHHKRLQDRMHTNCAGHTSIARLHDPVFLSALQNVIPHVGACKHKVKVEWWRRVHLPGHSGTRLTAYHISWHVASTFKRLATTTTCCDLINFIQNRQGKTLGHGIAHGPIHYPYSDCRIVNIQLLYRASDRKCNKLNYCGMHRGLPLLVGLKSGMLVFIIFRTLLRDFR